VQPLPSWEEAREDGKKHFGHMRKLPDGWGDMLKDKHAVGYKAGGKEAESVDSKAQSGQNFLARTKKIMEEYHLAVAAYDDDLQQYEQMLRRGENPGKKPTPPDLSTYETMFELLGVGKDEQIQRTSTHPDKKAIMQAANAELAQFVAARTEPSENDEESALGPMVRSGSIATTAGWVGSAISTQKNDQDDNDQDLSHQVQSAVNP
jgi:hypothetical protein